MNASSADLADFLSKHAVDSERPLAGDADLFDQLGVDGDDAFEFMDDFGGRFEVELDDYRWYFHHGEEGHNLGGLFFPPPYRRVERIPITVDTLREAIRTKRWPIRYPDHNLPNFRWDILVNQVLGVAFLGLFGFWLWKSFVR